MVEELRIEMSWTRAVPLLLEIYANGTPQGRQDAKDELLRCARIADTAVVASENTSSEAQGG